ncbi:hypothetical protein QBC41DRAFT_328350 [Cercophora samala]|uniref:Uncharacterized protein n=1 Tax=Cercophora samala TaxID=330535 RepID=A0AA39Z5V0_9PEZI|nr:hypothetical protein QBC41DRAFT_328350 [Cercophora samala]
MPDADNPFSPVKMTPKGTHFRTGTTPQGKRPRSPSSTAVKPSGKKPRRGSADGAYLPDKELDKMTALEDMALEDEFLAVASWDEDVHQLLEDGPVEQWFRLRAMVGTTVEKISDHRAKLKQLREKKRNAEGKKLSNRDLERWNSIRADIQKLRKSEKEYRSL